MKKFLLLILTFLSSVSLMAIGTENGSTKDFVPDKSNVETSVCDEATELFIDGNVVNNSTTPSLEPCLNAIPISLGETVTAPANEERWYVLDITEVHEMQQEFRWIFTKLSDINAEINMSMYYDCEDALYYSPFFEIFNCSSQYISVRAWSYKELTNFAPEYISSLYIHIAPTEDITMRFSLPAACEEDAIEIDWCNVQLSQLSTGWYKWNVADIHLNQEDVVFNVINDLMYPTTVTMDFYANCENTEPINDFGGSQTYALGNNQQTMSYKRFVELFATSSDIFGESIETGFHNDVYIHISSIEEVDEPEPTLETHLIHYTSTNGKIVTPYKTDGFGANIISNTYKDGQGVITFDGPVTNIGQEAFSGSNITSIVIPESVQTIGASAFHSCYELTSISLPENLKNIDFATFAYCSRLPKISIPHNVTSIGTSAFYGCPTLTTLYANPTTPPSLGSSAFENSSLDTVYVPCGSTNAYKSSSWNTYCTNFIEPEILYSVNLHSADTIKGQVAFDQEPSCDNTAIIRAIPSSGYRFTTWNDGVTNNPRTLFLSQDTTFTANFELIILDAEYVTICYGESYTWDKNGQTYTEAGTYTSISSEGEATLYLTVLPEVPITNDSATICYGETYSWNGHTYTESGDYVYTTTAANGCDSIVTLHLTINQTQYAEESIVACDSYEWNGEAYTESGEYTYTTTAANGCDSIVTLHLTVNKTQYAEETIVACDSYEWNGKTYTESGEYTYTTTAANGCDSIVTLHLTINKSEVGAIEYTTICYDETYTWNGQTYAVSGEYSVTLTNAAGCDSLAVLSITVLPEAIVDEQSISISENELPYTWHNQEINGSGVYTYTIPYTQTECDSAIYILNVEVETDTLENKCGDDLYWIYDTGNLTITGTGDMYDYTPTSMPWQTLSKEIRTILLPDEMSSIGAFAFTDCYYLPSINIPSSVVTINDGAFENCRLLSTISFANNGQLTTIGSWAFYNCHELKDVVIPEGVTKIGHAAFYGCTYLKDLTLPASLQSIADNGFAGCSKLAQIQVNAIIPPQVNARTFEEVDRSIPVIVPDESVEQYKSAPIWKEFNVRGKIGTGVENITSTTNNVQKILRNGQLLILRDDKTYNIVGQIVE